MYTFAPNFPIQSRFQPFHVPGIRWRGLGATSVQQMISDASARYGVPSWLALAVARRESGFDQAARGTSGEIGVFQLMPGTARDLGVNPSDLSQNIDGGVRYLQQNYQRFGNWLQALEAYNGGGTNVQRGTVSSAAQQYADAILANAPESSGSPMPSPADSGFAIDSGDSQWLPSDSSPGISPLMIGAIGAGALLLAALAAR